MLLRPVGSLPAPPLWSRVSRSWGAGSLECVISALRGLPVFHAGPGTAWEVSLQQVLPSALLGYPVVSAPPGVTSPFGRRPPGRSLRGPQGALGGTTAAEAGLQAPSANLLRWVSTPSGVRKAVAVSPRPSVVTLGGQNGASDKQTQPQTNSDKLQRPLCT